jgi:hypothetical protein
VREAPGWWFQFREKDSQSIRKEITSAKASPQSDAGGKVVVEKLQENPA